MPLINGRVKLHPRIGTRPRRVGDLIPQLARLERLARLGGAMKPSVVVTSADLDKIGTRVPEFYTGDLFRPLGKTPLYLGQPVGLLIFETFDAFDQARLALRDGTFVRFGEETGPVAMPNYGATFHACGRSNP